MSAEDFIGIDNGFNLAKQVNCLKVFWIHHQNHFSLIIRIIFSQSEYDLTSQ